MNPLRSTLLLLLALALTTTAQAQHELEVVAHLPDAASLTVEVRDTLAFSGSDSTLIVLNIADASIPERLAHVNLPLRPFDLVVGDTMAYVVGSGAMQFATVNVSDAHAPRFLDAVEHEWGSEVGRHVRLRGDTAFVAAGLGLVHSRMFDVSDPVNIHVLGDFASALYDIAFTDGALYGFGQNGPYYRQVAGWTPLAYSSFQWFGPEGWSLSAEIMGEYLYAHVDRGLYVFEIVSDNLAPTEVARIPELGQRLELAVANNRVFIAGRENGLIVVDVTEPSQLEIVARFDVDDAVDVAVSDSLIFLSAGEDGLYILREATATAVEQPPPGFARTPMLEAPVPHPVSGQAVIRFQLPEPGRVRLTVYDLLGREVTQVVDGFRASGYHEISWEPSGLAGGTYVMRLEAGSHRTSMSFTVVL